MEESGVVLPVIEAQCAYRSPARYDDLLEIRTEGRVTSPVRMEFTYEVAEPAGKRVLASGRTAHAAVTKLGRPCRLPARVREAFS